MDLTKIDQPFGRLDIETKLALHRAYYEGVQIVWVNKNTGAEETFSEFRVFDDVIYRAKPVPLQVPWDAIWPKWKFAARKRSGDVYLFTSRPYCDGDSGDWCPSKAGEQTYLSDMDIYKVVVGTVDWAKSLIQRPEGV